MIIKNDTRNKLPGIENDVIKIKEIGDRDNMTIMRNFEHDIIIEFFNNFHKFVKKQYTDLLIVYSGHGYQDEANFAGIITFDKKKYFLKILLQF